MRREIRFRAWHTGKKIMFSAEEMAADQLTLLPTGQFINVSSVRPSMSTIYPADKLIPLQFTGLKDRNGREIYEGDVVLAGENKCLVKWNQAFASFCLVKSGWMHSHYFGESVAPEECEIIGNIHENPELLEGR